MHLPFLSIAWLSSLIPMQVFAEISGCTQIAGSATRQVCLDKLASDAANLESMEQDSVAMEIVGVLKEIAEYKEYRDISNPEVYNGLLIEYDDCNLYLVSVGFSGNLINPMSGRPYNEQPYSYGGVKIPLRDVQSWNIQKGIAVETRRKTFIAQMDLTYSHESIGGSRLIELFEKVVAQPGYADRFFHRDVQFGFLRSSADNVEAKKLFSELIDTCQ